MATKRYWVGKPNIYSKLRPVKYDKLPVENKHSKFERQFREKNEALAKWNHDFWSEHNQRYDLERRRFLEHRANNVKDVDMKSNQMENFDDKILAEFYKKFLDDNWRRHWDYNWAWYRRHVELISLAFKEYSMSPDIPHCNDQPIVEMGESVVNILESPIPSDTDAPDSDTLSPTDLGYVALPTHDDSESRFTGENDAAVDSNFDSIVNSNLTTDGAIANGSSENVIQRDRIPLSLENVDKIKDLMSRLNIPPPPWAQSVPEDEWKSFLISRLTLDR